MIDCLGTWLIVVCQSLLDKIIHHIPEITFKPLHLLRFQKSYLKQIFHFVVTHKWFVGLRNIKYISEVLTVWSQVQICV